MADWSMLPSELLGEILLKLDFIEDVIFFSMVCNSWHCAYSMIGKKWCARTPLLMLCENTKDNPNYLRKLFCPSKNKCYQLKVPETFGARCWGTSLGWVVTLDLSLEMYLFNPLTKVRIRVPPQTTMPYYRSEGRDRKIDPEHSRNYFLDRVFVFDGDDGGKDLLVIAITKLVNNSSGHLAYTWSSDQAWTSIISPNSVKFRSVVDVVRWGSQILFLYRDGFVGYCDMNALQNSQSVTLLEYLPIPLEISTILEDLRSDVYKLYLLESFGDLLLVLRYKELVPDPNDPNEEEWDKDVCYRTVDFKVYKLDFGLKIWKEVKDLGGVSLFVGQNNAMSLNVSYINNVKCNCIYFTDDEWQFWQSPTNYGGHDIGINPMGDEDIEPLYDGDDIHSRFCTALWFLPKF